MVEKRERKQGLQVSRFSGAGDGTRGSSEKETEYSVKSDGIFLTPLTESVKTDGIFLTASVDAVSVPGTCLRVAGAWGHVRRWKIFLKIWGCS